MRRAVSVLLAGVWLVGGCAPRVPVVEIEAQPSSEASTPSPTPSTDTARPTTSPSPTDSPSPTETGPHDPTDTDRARFVAAYEPSGASSLQHVATDVDGDEVQEVLFAYVRGGQSARIDVAWWTGTAYEVAFAGDGGPATSLDELRVADVNGDGLTELITRQSADGGRESVSLWQVRGAGDVVALPAAGGCHDGSNTYGVTGVRFEDRDADAVDEIYATCEDGSTARYRWETGAYRNAPELVR